MSRLFLPDFPVAGDDLRPTHQDEGDVEEPDHEAQDSGQGAVVDGEGGNVVHDEGIDHGDDEDGQAGEDSAQGCFPPLDGPLGGQGGGFIEEDEDEDEDEDENEYPDEKEND